MTGTATSCRTDNTPAARALPALLLIVLQLGLAAGLQYPASSIQYPVSSTQIPVPDSSTQIPVPRSQYQIPVPSIQYPVSSIQYYGTFWRHFAVLTINGHLTLKRDHLFLVREGCGYQESQEFKVVVYQRLFETGSMTGLMALFGRHSWVMTNFSILLMESRLKMVLGYGCGSRVCGGPSRPGVPGDTVLTLYLGLVGPWQYQSVGGWVGTRYTHPPYPPGPHVDQHPAHDQHGYATGPGTPRTCTYDQFGDGQGDPRGG